MQKLVIGCGYLGLRLARKWIAHNDEVYALTRSQQNAEKLRTEGIMPIIGDVTKPDTLKQLSKMGEWKTVLYAVGYDRNSKVDKREIYVTGLENVLNYVAEYCDRLLYISSTSVFGQTNAEWVDEQSQCNPTTDNGRICLDAEQVVRQYMSRELQNHEKLGKRTNILRLAGIYGPGRLLARVKSLMSGTPLGGNPQAWLNLIHVDDAVTAVLACEERSKTGETYLICDDRPVQRRIYYETLASLVDAPRPTFNESSGTGTRVSALNKRISNRKMHEELGIQLAFPTLEEGLPHAVEVV